jgi:hypothetical protein
LLFLAKTYDPKYLPEKRYGLQRDEKKADELYSLATKAFAKQADRLRAQAPTEKQPTNLKEPMKPSLEGENISTSEKVFRLLRTTKPADEPEPSHLSRYDAPGGTSIKTAAPKVYLIALGDQPSRD